MIPPRFRHSVSRANMFRESADWFVARYLLNYKDEPNAKMAAGTAVEKAAHAGLIHEYDIFAVVSHALTEFDNIRQGEIDKIRDDIAPLAHHAMEALRPFGKPLTYQQPVFLDAGERFGLRFPVSGYTDFGYDGFDIDLKVTWALPSKPKFGHICQVGTYSKLRGDKPQKLCYVTPKKSAIYDVSPEALDLGWRTTLATWKRIETLLSVIDRPEDATRLIPLNLDSFYWPDNLKTQALQAWGI